MKEHEVDIIDILIILAKHKKFLILSLLIVSVLAVTYSLLVEQKWSSRAVFIPVYTSSPSASMMGSLLSGGIGGLLGSSSPASDVIELILSRTFLEDIIEHFKLVEFLEIEDDDPLVVRHKVLKQVREDMLSVGQDVETGIVKVSVTTKDKFLSADIANFVVTKLDNYYRNDRLTKGKEERIFLEKRITQISEEIEKLTLDIKAFQIQSNVLDLEKQLPPLLSAYTNIASEYLTTEMNVNVLKKYLPTDNELIKKEEYKKDELQRQLKQLETGGNSIISYQVPLDSIPTITQKYTLLRTRSEILKKTYETIFPQFELAKLQELRDTHTLQIIDSAVPAGQRTWPKRAMMCVVIFMAAFFSLTIFVLFKELLHQKVSSDAIYSDKMKTLKKYVSGK